MPSGATTIRREIRDARTVVLSFPKAGRSWLCYFLARYVAERARGPFRLDAITGGSEIPPVRFSHEHMDVFVDVQAPARLLSEDLLTQRRVIVLVRDPRDTLVSYWHHKRVRQRLPVPASVELFAESPVYGIERIAQGTSLLLDLYHRHPGAKLFMTYEELVAEPQPRLRDVLEFVLDGMPVDERCCCAALAASSFEGMRAWERGLSVAEARVSCDDRFGSLGSRRDDAAFKVRRGKAGGFKTEMSPALQQHVATLPHTAALLARLRALAPQPAVAHGT